MVNAMSDKASFNSAPSPLRWRRFTAATMANAAW